MHECMIGQVTLFWTIATICYEPIYKVAYWQYCMLFDRHVMYTNLN